MLTNSGCKSVGVTRLFIIWGAHPDADRILIQGLNEAFYSDQAITQSVNRILASSKPSYWSFDIK